MLRVILNCSLRAVMHNTQLARTIIVNIVSLCNIYFSMTEISDCMKIIVHKLKNNLFVINRYITNLFSLAQIIHCTMVKHIGNLQYIIMYGIKELCKIRL